MGWPVEVWYAESKKRNLLLLEHSEVHVDFCVFMCVWVLCIGMYMCRCVYEWVYMDVCPYISAAAAAAAAKSLQLCPTLCNPTDGTPPGSAVPGILQVRTLEWFAISFSNA